MKSNWLLGIGLVGIGTFFFSAVSILTAGSHSKRFPEKEVVIAIRQIGHELLRHAGDSTSRILPVKQTDASTFQLEFQSQFTFIPDSLVKIVTKSLSRVSTIHQGYVVNVLGCHEEEVIYGFQIGLLEKTTLVPCLGREQAIGCYVIQISFLNDPKQIADQRYLFMFAAAGLLVLFVSGRTLLKEKRLRTITQREQGVTIGAYEFWAERRILKHDNQLVELSDKETKLLKIFSAKINQPIEREQLMKEVWEDEGVIVGRSLDVFVSKLRKKLKEDPSVQLVSIHGVGYALEVH